MIVATEMSLPLWIVVIPFLIWFAIRCDKRSRRNRALLKLKKLNKRKR